MSDAQDHDEHHAVMNLVHNPKVTDLDAPQIVAPFHLHLSFTHKPPRYRTKSARFLRDAWQLVMDCHFAGGVMQEAGIAEELEGIHLGDERLNRRSRRILTALAVNCEASINAAMDGWADTQAAYRFFRNEQVTPEQILAPHVEATERRMSQQATVLVLQDTTSFNFSAHPARDQRCLCEPTQQGFYQHVNLAVTTERLPLGVLSVESFDRASESFVKESPKPRRARDPIETKESFRCLKGFRLLDYSTAWLTFGPEANTRCV